MTRAELASIADDARAVIAIAGNALPAGSTTRKAIIVRATRIAWRCDHTLALQASEHAPVVELFGETP